jgi:isoleucyl-tRNA synthetase
MAPLTPFLSEEIYKNLAKEESVHLAVWPTITESKINHELLVNMTLVRKICELAHAKRKKAAIRVRQPLLKITYKTPYRLPPDLEKLIAEEVNVKTVDWEKSKLNKPEITLDTQITQLLKNEGQARDLIRQIQELRKKEKLGLAEKIELILPEWPKEFEGVIKKETLTVKILKGEKVQIARRA